MNELLFTSLRCLYFPPFKQLSTKCKGANKGKHVVCQLTLIELLFFQPCMATFEPNCWIPQSCAENNNNFFKGFWWLLYFILSSKCFGNSLARVSFVALSSFAPALMLYVQLSSFVQLTLVLIHLCIYFIYFKILKF